MGKKSTPMRLFSQQEKRQTSQIEIEYFQKFKHLLMSCKFYVLCYPIELFKHNISDKFELGVK